MGMSPMTMHRPPKTDAASAATPGTRRVSADLMIGLSLLGVAILGKLLWVVTDGGILAVVGAR